MNPFLTDNFYTHSPKLDKQDDFNHFWKQSLIDTKQVPLEPVMKKSSKHSTKLFDAYTLQYNGCQRTPAMGMAFVPKGKKKSAVIVNIHDYNKATLDHYTLTDNNFAYVFLYLRGHHFLKDEIVNEEKRSPGFLTEGLLEKESYYVKYLYFDIFRAIEMLRLIPKFDCTFISIIGKGLGAAGAIFAATMSQRIKALVLEAPAFCELPLSQNISASEITKEINSFLPHRRDKKKIIKTNLTYFDILNFSKKIACPVLTVVGLKDKIAPTICTFGLFNHISTEKTMEIYPEAGNDFNNENQFNKNIQWIKEIRESL